MKKNLFSLSVFTLLLTIALVSCQKDKSDDNTDDTNYDTEASVQSQDQSNFSSQIDAVTADANIILQSSGSYAGRPEEVIAGVCNATYAMDSSNNPRTITITYNGANCIGTHSRTGTVVISMPSGTRWKNAGATLTFTYTNLVITRLSDHKSITINGSHTLTNVSGGLFIHFPVVSSLTHKVESNGITVKFDDNTVRTWKIARQQTYTYNNGIVLTVTGTHTEGNITNVAEWGTNRFGRTFTTAITQPLVFRQDCSFRLVSGEVTHTVPVFTAVGTFGLNAAGAPTSCPGAGSYYCKLIWTGPNNTHTIIFPY